MSASHAAAANVNESGRALHWRALHLGRVSEAASALAGTRVPEALIEPGAISSPCKETSAGLTSSSLTVRPSDSFHPETLLSHSGPVSKLARARRLLVSVLAAIIILLGAEEFTSTRAPRLAIGDGAVRSVLSSETASETVVEPSTPRLIVHAWRGTTNQPGPLGVIVHGPADQVVVRLIGLMPGMEVSAGNAVGPSDWEIATTQLEYAWIAPPEAFAGTAEVVAELRLPNGRIADRQILQLEWLPPSALAAAPELLADPSALPSVSPDPIQPKAPLEQVEQPKSLNVVEVGAAPVPSIPAAPVQEQRAEGNLPEVAPQPSYALATRGTSSVPATLLESVQLKADREENAQPDVSAPPQRRIDSEDIAFLLKRGKQLFASDDLAAARVVLRKAADANNAEGALALAATYDPQVLRELKVYGVLPDAALARVWYEKASELGSPGAARRLEILSQGTRAR
jgi:hypothetical protein